MDLVPPPQPLDHRPHRPRQVDAGRPHPRAQRRRRRPGHARAVPRLDGPRAGAGHHHQGPERAARLEGPRPQPDRHARPRRLRLRGVPLAGRLRGRDPRSSTPPRASRPRRWPTATWPSSTTSRSSPRLNKIDLPAADPDRYAGGDRAGARHPRRRHPAHQRQDRRGRARAARRRRRAHPAARRATPTRRCRR